MNYNELKTCLCCGSDDIETILDLTEQPLANSYKINSDDDEDRYPLQLNLCKKCYHTQLSVAVNPDLLFKHYLYVSGTSSTLNEYSKDFSLVVKEYFEKTNNKSPKNILDIACNDGTQLNHFKNIGLETYGIDPAENLHELSSVNHNVICDYYDSHNKFGHKFDLILAQNVFAHNSNPLQFLSDCKEDLSDDGLLFIQTSQANMIVNNEFDTIYHEHISFFNSNSMNELSKRAGIYLIDVMKTDIHGTSYVFVFSKNNIVTDNVSNSLEKERQNGLYDLETYKKYSTNAHNIVNTLKNTIEEYKVNNFRVVGYGAAAKGNTLLNFGNIQLDYIIDDNPLKQGLYTPGTGILIGDVSYLDNITPEEKVLFVPLAWNFFKEIRSKILKRRDNGGDSFVKYFPEVKVD